MMKRFHCYRRSGQSVAAASYGLQNYYYHYYYRIGTSCFFVSSHRGISSNPFSSSLSPSKGDGLKAPVAPQAPAPPSISPYRTIAQKAYQCAQAAVDHREKVLEAHSLLYRWRSHAEGIVGDIQRLSQQLSQLLPSIFSSSRRRGKKSDNDHKKPEKVSKAMTVLTSSRHDADTTSNNDLILFSSLTRMDGVEDPTDSLGDEAYQKRLISRLIKYYNLPTKHRMNLIPKRHIGFGLWNCFWNFRAMARNVIVAPFLFAARGIILYGREKNVFGGSVLGLILGMFQGLAVSTLYLLFGGVVNPILHVGFGLWNNVQGAWYSIFHTRKYFEASIGFYRWIHIVKPKPPLGTTTTTGANKNLDSESAGKKKLFSNSSDDDEKKNINKIATTTPLQLQRHMIEILAVGHQQYEGQKRRFLLKEKKKRDTGSDRPMVDKVADAFSDASQMKRERLEQAFGYTTGGPSQQAAPDDLYDILHLKRSASLPEIKSSYKKLAKIYHPDVQQQHQKESSAEDVEREMKRNQEEFQRIAKAYKVLSNPETRRAYDIGGIAAAENADSPASILKGTPMEVLQLMFGGNPFEHYLLGTIFRAPQYMSTHNMCHMTGHEFECLQTVRLRMISMELARILDVYAVPRTILEEGDGKMKSDKNSSSSSSSSAMSSGFSQWLSQQKLGTAVDSVIMNFLSSNDAMMKGGTNAEEEKVEEDANLLLIRQVKEDFIKRAVLFFKRMSKCSFAPEILYELGTIYEMNARRYLGEVPWFYPKMLSSTRFVQGFQSIYALVQACMARNLTQQHLISVFVMEWDNVVVDVHAVVRFACMCVLNDHASSLFSVNNNSGGGGRSKNNPLDQESSSSDGQQRRHQLFYRRHALKFLGQLLQKMGQKWGDRPLEAYVHHLKTVATSDWNKKIPPGF